MTKLKCLHQIQNPNDKIILTLKHLTLIWHLDLGILDLFCFIKLDPRLRGDDRV